MEKRSLIVVSWLRAKHFSPVNGNSNRKDVSSNEEVMF